MAANAGTPVIGKRKHHRQRVMSEINVTPMVDVMLVLLIIFMVTAPMLTAGIEVVRPVEANIVFARFAPGLARRLNDEGFRFFDWPIFGPDIYRLVAGFATSEEDVDALAAACAAAGTPL